MSTTPTPSEGEHRPAETPLGAEPEPATEPGRELEYLVDRSRLRRAPRFGRIIVLGMVAGLLVAAGLALFSEPSQLSTGNLFGLLLLTCVPIGALAGAVVALLLDRRSWRRADRASR